jgi:hypothetical protein
MSNIEHVKEKEDLPFLECNLCRTLDDCKHVDKTSDDIITWLPPNECPKPFIIMRRTTRKWKLSKREAKN